MRCYFEASDTSAISHHYLPEVAPTTFYTAIWFRKTHASPCKVWTQWGYVELVLSIFSRLLYVSVLRVCNVTVCTITRVIDPQLFNLLLQTCVNCFTATFFVTGSTSRKVPSFSLFRLHRSHSAVLILQSAFRNCLISAVETKHAIILSLKFRMCLFDLFSVLKSSI